jgi:aspartate/methionine/tyrosine aminotransferase
VGAQQLNDIPALTSTSLRRLPATTPKLFGSRTSTPTIQPPVEVIDAARAAIGADYANSWLPFSGRDDLKDAVAAFIERRGGRSCGYLPKTVTRSPGARRRRPHVLFRAAVDPLCGVR